MYPRKHKPGGASMACARGPQRLALGYGLKPGIAVALPLCANALRWPPATQPLSRVDVILPQWLPLESFATSRVRISERLTVASTARRFYDENVP